MDKLIRRKRKKLHNRKKIFGTQEKPRMSVFRSLKNISIQVIDDEKGITLVSASTLQNKDFKGKNNIDTARKIGAIVAKESINKGIKQVVFDRSCYKFHGKIKALADSAKENGLKF